MNLKKLINFMAKYVPYGSDPNQPTSHKMTRGDMEVVHRKQIEESFSDEDFIPANKAPEYKIKAYEKHLYHVRLEAKAFNPQTGEKISRPKTVMYEKDFFLDTMKKNRLTGYTIEVLHDPTELANTKKKTTSK